MLQNAYFLAKISADTAENEQHFAEICQPTLRAPADASPQRNPCWTAAVPVDDEQQDRGLRLCEDI